MLVSKLLTECSNILIDSGNTRWTASELLDYYNMAVRLVTILAPESYTTTEVLTMVAGARQTLPGESNRLVAVIQNMGTSGVDEGRGITLVNKEIMDRTYPGWAIDANSETVIHYMYDGNKPNEFYIYPANDGTGTVRLTYSLTPDDVTDTSDTILLKPDYIPSLFEAILWYAFTKDSDNPNSAQKAEVHKATLRNLIVAKGGVDMEANPNLNEVPPMRKK